MIFQNSVHIQNLERSSGECMQTEKSVATKRTESPLMLSTPKSVVITASTSLDDIGDVIADVARMLQFVQASRPY